MKKLITIAVLLICVEASSQLNSFSDLRTRKAVGRQTAVIRGGYAPYDSLAGIFAWCDTCVSSNDDGVNFFRNASWPSGQGWKRVPTLATVQLLWGMKRYGAGGIMPDSTKIQTVQGAENKFQLKGNYLIPFDTINKFLPLPYYNNSASRSLNTSFRLHLNRPARVSYSVTLSTNNSVVNVASVAQIYLEISQNNSTWITISGAGTSRIISLGAMASDAITYNVQGEVPAGWYVRLRSVVSGGGAASYLYGQEVTN